MGLFGAKREEDLPEELRGLTAAQVLEKINVGRQALDLAKAQEAELATLKAGDATTKSELAQTREALAALNAANRKPVVENNNQPQRLFVTDEEEDAFNTRLNNELAPLRAGLMFNSAMLARQAAEHNIAKNRRDSIILGKYRNEVEELFKRVPAQNQVFSDAFENCFALVKAKHMDEIMEAIQKNDVLFTEPAGPSGVRPDDNARKDTLSPDESSIARRMGISDVDWTKSRKEAVVYGR
jgi:hypothetical protein